MSRKLEDMTYRELVSIKKADEILSAYCGHDNPYDFDVHAAQAIAIANNRIE